MIAPYEPLIEFDGSEYFPQPYTSLHLSTTRHNGMLAIAILATLSVLSTASLILFILCRFVTWNRHYKTFVGYNQYVVLVLNLLLADLQQSSAFLIEWHWYRKKQILAPSPACFAQGWMLHSGDVGSAFFVLSIAVHTFYTAVLGKRFGQGTFTVFIVGVWVATYFLTAIGVGVYGAKKYFTAAGAWCWISPAYEAERLWCHYLWIFVVEFGTVMIYILTFFKLRAKTKELVAGGNDPKGPVIKAVNRITMFMTLYPMVYIALTLPLSSGRMWSLSHGGQPTSDLFSVIAGSLLTSCGWIDSLLYTLTRRRLLKDTMPGGNSSRRNQADPGADWELNTLGDKGISHTRSVRLEGGTIVDMNVPLPGQRQFSEDEKSASGTLDLILSGKGPRVVVISEEDIGIAHGSPPSPERRRWSDGQLRKSSGV